MSDPLCTCCGQRRGSAGALLGGSLTCGHCALVAAAIDEFATELSADLRRREQAATEHGLGDSVGLLVAMRNLLAGRAATAGPNDP